MNIEAPTGQPPRMWTEWEREELREVMRQLAEAEAAVQSGQPDAK